MKIPKKPPETTGLLALPPGARVEVDGKYLHWDELRHRSPPAGLDHEAWWSLIAYARAANSTELPLHDVSATPFRYTVSAGVLERLFEVDVALRGQLETPELGPQAPLRERHAVSSLMEEATQSSQLEGSATTRDVAKEMLRSGRAPRSIDERMILNNYRAMAWIREHHERPITVELVLELHRVISEGTLDGASDGAGRFRRADERIEVFDPTDGEVVHTPPPAETLPARMAALCRFASAEPSDGFVFPLVRSILLHFWMGFDHPFVDGNGRTARALFYWSMLKQGYWLTEYISLSGPIKKAAAQYSRAYLFAETDHDVTYFLVNQLQMLRVAIEDLKRYLSRKVQQRHDAEHVLARSAWLNPRQLALLGHALRHRDHEYTVEGHRRSHDTVYETARKDLQELAERGWLKQQKRGRAFVYVPAVDLDRRVSGKRVSGSAPAPAARRSPRPRVRRAR